MAFVDGNAIIDGSAATIVDPQGSLMMSGGATTIDGSPAVIIANLVRAPAVARVRALNSTRIRIDFDIPVKSDSALIDARNYALKGLNGAVDPLIVRVDVPLGASVLFVELIVTEMTGGSANYLLAVNSSGVALGAELMADGNMEAPTAAAWTAGAGATLSKQTGGPDGGVRVLRVASSTSGFVVGYQTGKLVIGRHYRLTGYARSVDGTSKPLVTSSGTNQSTALFYGSGATAFEAFDVDFQAPVGANSDRVQLGRDSPDASARSAEFDNISVREWSSSTTVAPPITDASGATPVADELVLFDGIGVAPSLVLAFALSPTLVEVRFSEPILDYGDVRNVAAWLFDLGLSVLSVVSVGTDSVTLQTSAQAEGQLYTLTFDGVVYDNAMNAMSAPVLTFDETFDDTFDGPSSLQTPMLGFVPSAPERALLTLRIYLFFIQGIRDADQERGAQMLERYLEGPQTIWAAIVKTIFDIPKLWSAEECPDSLLQYLKRIVGWTKATDSITDALDLPTLRRLIAASVPFWKSRGPEPSIEDILRLTTAARLQLLNWFDFRMILDELQLGEDYDGHDPWLLSTPGEGEPDAWTYNIRIVDNGELDKNLVRDLAKLTRPTGERVLITYLGFLDLFETDDDNSQWRELNGNPTDNSQVVSGGTYTLESVDAITNETMADVVGSSDWASYVASWTIRTDTKFRLTFYRAGDADYYWVEVTPTDGFLQSIVALGKTVAGVETQLDFIQVNTTFDGEEIEPDVYYTYRVEVAPLTPGNSTNHIAVYWDGLPALEADDADQAQGTIGFQLAGDPGRVELKQIEMFFLPAGSDFIDINT